MATYANLYVDQGADYDTIVTLQDARSDSMDLTSLTINGQIRRSYRSETAYDFTISKESEQFGEIRVRLFSDTTRNMNYGRYVYDIYAEDDNSGTRFKVLEGILEVVPGVTRDEQ